MNEGTIRDWVRHAKFNVTQGKNFDNTGVIGPWMMTADEVADHLLRGVERRKRTVILTSQGKMTVFLNKLFPKFMDRMVFNHFRKEPDSPLK